MHQKGAQKSTRNAHDNGWLPITITSLSFAAIVCTHCAPVKRSYFRHFCCSFTRHMIMVDCFITLQKVIVELLDVVTQQQVALVLLALRITVHIVV